MATIKQLSSGAFQIRVTSKLLPKPFYASFETREQALAYSNHLRELLAQGIVPQALLKVQETVRQEWMISRCIAEYLRSESVPISEVKLLDNIRSKVGNLKTSDLSYDWADVWTRQLKRQDNLAPSTIRHRHGALARCLDWMCRKHPEILVTNPLRLLKRGFATYTAEDKKYVLAQGGTPKIDVERNRRLEEEEEQRILAILKDLPEEKTFFVLALESAMRMRECYTLDIDQVSLQKRTVHLVRTKNGDSREVPIRDSGTECCLKVRMYGCNLFLLNHHEMNAWQTGGVHVRPKAARPGDFPRTRRWHRHSCLPRPAIPAVCCRELTYSSLPTLFWNEHVLVHAFSSLS